MARVTVEDCILKVPNRFELVMLSSQRAREIGAGGAMMVDRDNDKNPVVALREIADTDIDLQALGDQLVKNHQKVMEIEEENEEILDVMEGETEWAAAAAEAVEEDLAGAGMQEEDFSEAEDDVSKGSAAAEEAAMEDPS